MGCVKTANDTADALPQREAEGVSQSHMSLSIDITLGIFSP